MSESVSELVGLCRAGERAAESALAHRAASQALRTASVAMDDLDAARDVSQEVAVRVLRGISGLRAPERFDAWVFRITVSEIRRSYGRTRRRAEVSLDAQGENCELAGAAEPDEMLFVSRELRAALADLSWRERTALALRYVHDLDDDRIANSMRCRPGTVRSLLSRARASLRTHPALVDHAPVSPDSTVTRLDPDPAPERSS
jgi:RNA polymerase sigma-70 factor (ECF subfamily)